MAEHLKPLKEQERQRHPVAAGLKAGSAAAGPADRQRLLARAADLDRVARGAAERGELTSAARKILESLDCERRAGGLGPQVLQLIKPRS